MKFLNVADNARVIPMKILYTWQTDTLMIVYKDLNLNKKFVENISEPKVPVYIIKPEYRNQTGSGVKFDCSYRHDWLPKDLCDEHLVRYKFRKYEIAKILGCKPEEVETSPYVGWGDLTIENIYCLEFMIEYHTDISDFKPSVAYSDIEADVKNVKGVGRYGEVPITCIVYIDSEHMQVYQLAVYNPEFGKMDEVVNSVDDICREYGELFNEFYGDFKYHLLIFKKEEEMLACYWELARKVDNDFIEFWNAPYDVQNLSYRPATLGYNSFEFIHDKDFATAVIDIYEDHAAIVKKRKHKFKLSIKPIMCCEMRNYAGIRAAKPVLPTYKLNAIANIEIRRGKVDYSEEGDLTTLLYTNLRKYLLYNLNDSLLQFGIDRETRDTTTLYSKMYKFALSEEEAFTSTKMLVNYLILFGHKNLGLILANNRNKNAKNSKDAQMLIKLGFGSDATDAKEAEEMDDALVEEYGIDLDAIIDNVNENQSVVDANGNKKKFAGAIVMHPSRQSWTGYKIAGRKAKHVHRFVIDEDITSEYPNAARAMNLSNDTWVGKLIVDDEKDFNLPFYSQYSFVGDDAKTYKCNVGAVFLETVAQGDYILAGEVGFGLPSYMDMMNILEEEGIVA